MLVGDLVLLARGADVRGAAIFGNDDGVLDAMVILEGDV